MMGRERNRNQLHLTDVEHLAGAPVVPRESFYGRMAEWGAQMVTDDLFADLYAKDGRASVPPGLCAKMLLLMFHDNVSERESEERTRYDLRWKHALHLGIGEHVDRSGRLGGHGSQPGHLQAAYLHECSPQTLESRSPSPF